MRWIEKFRAMLSAAPPETTAPTSNDVERCDRCGVAFGHVISCPRLHDALSWRRVSGGDR